MRISRSSSSSAAGGEFELGAGLIVGAIVNVHGIHGAIYVRMFDEHSQALVPGTQAMLLDDADAPVREVEVVEFEPGSRGRQRVRLAGVDDRDTAEALRGYKLWVRRDALAPLADDEFYLQDVVGAKVERVLPSGDVQELGRVLGIVHAGAQDLLEVGYGERKGQTWLLPNRPEYIREADAQRVLVDLPEGLLPEELESAPS